MSQITLTVPDIGDFKDVAIIEVLVKPGDRIAVEQPLVTLETDKATMDVPAEAAGIVASVLVRTGDKVSRGAPILLLDSTAAAAADTATPAPAATPAPLAAAPAAMAAPPAPTAAAPAPPPLHAIYTAPGGKPYASPSVRKFARELGVDIGRVPGSGPKGRILHDDVRAFVKQALAAPPANAAPGGLTLAPLPQVDFADYGPIEIKPLSKINKLTGANLHRNWVLVPHVTQFDQADITDLEQFRQSLAEELKARGVKLTLLAFLIKAAVSALKEFPRFNASLDDSGENLVLKHYCHIGFAVDTPDGLVVPVIRDADKKSVSEIAVEIHHLAQKARDKKLRPDDFKGGCFSISSLGGIGGTAFTPIINAPEVAILGVSRASMQPVWDGKAFQPRLTLPLSLSYDHRVIDGAAGARFTSHMAKLLSDSRRLLL
jgi:pyruvate dehydrogenase E2 component (dihydrolipoamide acetyltransferase)